MPERIEYQTKLKGFDDNWINRGNLTLTEYTNLPPGNYEFHVRARYPYSEWPASAASFHFTITPKFWQTLSFKVAMIVVLALALFTLYRLRFLHLKRSEAQLKLRVQAQTRSPRRSRLKPLNIKRRMINSPGWRIVVPLTNG